MKWICILDIYGNQYYTRTIQGSGNKVMFYDYQGKRKIDLPFDHIKLIFPSDHNVIQFKSPVI